jgi:glycosyltransferase involved in cell wall biosynthesis
LKPGAASQGTSKRFLAVGRFSHKHKGFDLLIKAFNIFAKNNKEWNLDIVGEGAEEDLYKELIKEYHLEKRITIHPFTNNVQSFYSNAQIYVLSSRWEGFGLVLVEAMAHGLPIISSDLPTSKEIMGDFGMYFKNGNIEDLAQRMEEATHIDWQAKSEEAMAIAQRFDIKNIITQWKQLIE